MQEFPKSKLQKIKKEYPSEFKKWGESRVKIMEVVKERQRVGKEYTIMSNDFKNGNRFDKQMDQMVELAKTLDKLKYDIELLENTIYLTEIAIGLRDGKEDMERLELLRELFK